MPIENLPKGAIPDPIDERDYKIETLGALPPVDWSKEFRLPNPGDEDQGSSLSCVAQATSYYHTQLHPANYSRRDVYARIFLPEGGAYLRDGVKAVVERGQATRDAVPDPQPQTETNMRDRTGVTAANEEAHKELNYFLLPGNDIDTVASTTKNYHGCLFGVTGSNPGWQDLLNPRPPKSGEATWGHALYGMGYHLHSGVKCIIAKSSWCNEVSEHHIKQEYFNSQGAVFNPWTLIPKGEQPMSQVKIVVIHGEAGVFLAADSIPQLQSVAKIFGKDVQVDASGNITNPDVVI
jgi:hypothetical protein